jgi:hypothetical protein
LLLPADPEDDIVDIDDELWVWMRNFQVVNVAGRNLRLGVQEIPTSHAAALVNSYGGTSQWTSYIAIYRSGAVEYGLGDRGAWEHKDNEGNLVRGFSLISIVARTWALLELASAFRDRVAVPGPHQLTIAMHRTGGAVLGNVGEGWAEPISWENDLPPCVDPHVLWHMELESWPDEEQARALAFRVGDRVEDAWGVRQRRYLARVGDLSGRFDVRQIRD